MCDLVARLDHKALAAFRSHSSQRTYSFLVSFRRLEVFSQDCHYIVRVTSRWYEYTCAGRYIVKTLACWSALVSAPGPTHLDLDGTYLDLLSKHSYSPRSIFV